MNHDDARFLEAFGEVTRNAVLADESVTLPGIGAIVVAHRRSRQFSDDQGTVVTAPGRELVFDADIALDQDAALVRAGTLCGASSSDARVFWQNALNRLASDRRLNLPGVGELVLENGVPSIHFMPVLEHAVNARYNGYVDLGVSRSAAAVEHTDAAEREAAAASRVDYVDLADRVIEEQEIASDLRDPATPISTPTATGLDRWTPIEDVDAVMADLSATAPHEAPGPDATAVDDTPPDDAPLDDTPLDDTLHAAMPGSLEAGAPVDLDDAAKHDTPAGTDDALDSDSLENEGFVALESDFIIPAGDLESEGDRDDDSAGVDLDHGPDLSDGVAAYDLDATLADEAKADGGDENQLDSTSIAPAPEEPEEVDASGAEDPPESNDDVAAPASGDDADNEAVVETDIVKKIRSPYTPSSRRSGVRPAVLAVAGVVVAGLLLVAWLSGWFGGNAPASDPSTDTGVAAQSGESVDPAPPATVTESSEPDGGEAATPPAVPTEPPFERGAINRAVGGFTIIVSSKESLGEATEYAASLGDRDEPVDILEAQVNGQIRYRVAVGQYRTFSLATRALNQATAQLPDGSWIGRIE